MQEVSRLCFHKTPKEILEWIELGKGALLVVGTRRVGKTYLIRGLFKEGKIDYVEFNFVKQPGLQMRFFVLHMLVAKRIAI